MAKYRAVYHPVKEFHFAEGCYEIKFGRSFVVVPDLKTAMKLLKLLEGGPKVKMKKR